MKKLVVLSGAGISAESGIKTFRDNNGLWEEYNVEDVASIDGWRRNRGLVIEFYNKRRAQLKEVEPNDAHKILASLENNYDITIITQNVDDLHERGGSTKVIHLHGELTKVRGEGTLEYEYLDSKSQSVFDIGYNEIKIGDNAPNGTQLRPHIVWFGEAVPLMESAAKIVSEADILLIIGTSLNVYPAAGLVNYTKKDCKIYLIDPKPINLNIPNFEQIKATATEGMKLLREKL